MTHAGLAPLAEAAALSAFDIAMRAMPDPPPAFANLPRRLSHPARLLASHIAFVPIAWAERRRDLIIAREFITVPLLLVWPLLWPLRRRLAFVVHHNVQMAHRRRHDALALRLLASLGARMIFLDEAAGVHELGVRFQPGQMNVIPHPLERVSPAGSRNHQSRPVVGVVGNIRPEKGTASLLNALIAARDTGQFSADILIGCPNPRALAPWQGMSLQIVETKTREQYHAALGACDVVAVNYSHDAYYFRPSGVVADAVSCGASVVCPNFPIFRSQITRPALVGRTFSSLAEIGATVRQTLAARQSTEDSWQAHIEHRSAPALSEVLSDMVRASRTPTNDAHREAATERG